MVFQQTAEALGNDTAVAALEGLHQPKTPSRLPGENC